MGPNDGSRLGDGPPNDPSVAAAFASIASARNRSFLDDVDRSGLVFWGCIGSFLTFSAVVAWRRHVAAATAGMNEEDLDAGGTSGGDCSRLSSPACLALREGRRVVGNS